MLMDDGNEVVKCNSRSITAKDFAVAPCYCTGLAVEVRCQAAISRQRFRTSACVRGNFRIDRNLHGKIRNPASMVMRLLGDALSPTVVVARRVDGRRQFDFSAVRFRYRRWNQEISGKLFEILVNVGFRWVPDFHQDMNGANDIQLCCHLTSLNEKRSGSNQVYFGVAVADIAVSEHR